MLAIRPKDLQIVCDAIGDEFNLVVCHTLNEAQAQLGTSLRLIVCGVRFDDGRMLDLLRYAKADPATRAIPFHVVLGSDRGYSEAVLTGIRAATKVLGASGFTDIGSLTAELGQAGAYEAIRQGIRELLGEGCAPSAR